MSGIGIAKGPQRRFKPYPAYKDSGVEWLGEIPGHWEVKALKRIGGLQAGAGFPDHEQGVTTEDLPFFKVGDMGSTGNEREMLEWQHTVSEATARRLHAFVFPPGTIVFAKVGAALMLNRRRVLTRPSCMDNNMMGFMPGDCDPTWAMYWLSGLDMRELANPGAVPSVNEGQMRETPAIVSPKPEQCAIAAFLDRATARIDALVAKKERLIELLQEKRTALITRAVTKGLDPSVPTKDSGVEWLGRIPAHWEVKRVKQLSRFVTSGSRGWAEHYADAGALFLRIGNLKTGSIDLDTSDVQHVNPPQGTEGERTRVRTGDLLISITALIGAVGVVPEGMPNAFVNQHLALVRLAAERVDPRWLGYCVLSRVGQEQLRAELYGGTKEGLGLEDIRSLTVLSPPMHEQRQIVGSLDAASKEVEALVAMIRTAIDRLKELRTALISAAVTGKIDVREEEARGASR